MKIKKSYLIVFILILHFNLIFQGTTNLFNGQYHKSSIRVATSLSASNSVELNWYCTWGGNLYDEAHGVAVDSSDNIYIAGLTNSFGAMDAVLVKYDSSGMQQWNRTWNGGGY
ncbi:MAG: SBBP repeat-containing protein, partial [Promethearchaeota archaeon]